MPRPIPVPNDLSKPFWDAATQGRLVVQNCTACHRNQFPPQPACAQCGSAEHLQWLNTSGRGTIKGYVVMHDSRIGMWHPEQPFNIAIAELEDDPAMLFFANLPGVPVDQVPVGAKVQVQFIEASPGQSEQKIPDWKVVS